jgi:F-type H+-transporting ATPase subunit c
MKRQVVKTLSAAVAALIVILSALCFSAAASSDANVPPVEGEFVPAGSGAPEGEQAGRPEPGQEGGSGEGATGSKAMATAILLGAACAAGAIGMGLAISKSTESMARQPEAAGKINSAMMLGLVFIETVVIYALFVAILIIFVL